MLASACIRNLRQTFRYGGRQTLPSKVEVLAATVGYRIRFLSSCLETFLHTLKRMPYFSRTGGLGRPIPLKSTFLPFFLSETSDIITVGRRKRSIIKTMLWLHITLSVLIFIIPEQWLCMSNKWSQWHNNTKIINFKFVNGSKSRVLAANLGSFLPSRCVTSWQKKLEVRNLTDAPTCILAAPDYVLVSSHCLFVRFSL